MILRKIIIITIILITTTILSGCYAVNNSIIIDENWNAIIGLDVMVNEYSADKEKMEDVSNQLKLFLPNLEGSIETTENTVRYTTKNTVNIDDFGFINKIEKENGKIRLEVNLPSIIHNKDSDGNPEGPIIFFNMYLPGKIIQANTIEYENDYIMQTTFSGKKKARITWELPARITSTPTELWVEIQPFEK